MTKNHSPSVVVITGATAGIGRATTREFAKHGYPLALLARGSARLKETVQEAHRFGSPHAIGIPTDVADANAVEKAAEKIEKELGPIGIWINNAMATIFSPVYKITPEEYKRATDVTYLGSVYGTMSALKRMRKRNAGTIVQVGSALAYRAIPLQAPYCGAKFALRGFLGTLRTELMHDQKNIHLTMVQLPAHNTPQFSWARVHIDKHPQPVPPIFQPEVAARAIYWAAFHRRREVWVGTSSVAAIIINRLFPRLADTYLAVTGYDSQVVNKPLEKNWPGNLFEPVKGRYAAHGIFDKQAKSNAPQFILEKIPILHIFTDYILAALTTLSMIPSFVGILLRSKHARKIAGI